MSAGVSVCCVSTSEHDTGDRLTCAGCIAVFGGYMLAERIAPVQTVCVMFFVFI